jgi:hypothetical protein
MREPGETLLRVKHAERGPATGHVTAAPALHVAGDTTDGAEHVLDRVGGREGASERVLTSSLVSLLTISTTRRRCR